VVRWSAPLECRLHLLTTTIVQVYSRKKNSTRALCHGECGCKITVWFSPTSLSHCYDRLGDVNDSLSWLYLPGRVSNMRETFSHNNQPFMTLGAPFALSYLWWHAFEYLSSHPDHTGNYGQIEWALLAAFGSDIVILLVSPHSCWVTGPIFRRPDWWTNFSVFRGIFGLGSCCAAIVPALQYIAVHTASLFSKMTWWGTETTPWL
jgi:hypothetical protein